MLFLSPTWDNSPLTTASTLFTRSRATPETMVGDTLPQPMPTAAGLVSVAPSSQLDHEAVLKQALPDSVVHAYAGPSGSPFFRRIRLEPGTTGPYSEKPWRANLSISAGNLASGLPGENTL